MLCGGQTPGSFPLSGGIGRVSSAEASSTIERSVVVIRCNHSGTLELAILFMKGLDARRPYPGTDTLQNLGRLYTGFMR